MGVAQDFGLPDQFVLYDNRYGARPSHNFPLSYVAVGWQGRQHESAKRVKPIKKIGVNFQQTGYPGDKINPSLARVGEEDMSARGRLGQSSGSVLLVHLIFIQLHHIEMALADIEQFRNIIGS